jgi:AraC-like DNA-binding protein
MNIASAFVSNGQLFRRPPDERLQSFVGCFWVLPCTPDTRIRSLPDGCGTLSVELSGCERPRSFITGPRLGPREIAPHPNLTLLGVRLRPGVVFALTHIPASELTDRREPLDRWRPADAAELESGATAASSYEQLFDVLEAFVGKRLADTPVDGRILRAIELIERCEGRMKIDQVAERCQVSARHLDRLFHQWVGLSPKSFARIMRFQASLARLDPMSLPDLAQMATGLGYFDQAHLSNEFAQLSGSSPRHVAPERVSDFSKTQCE